MKKSDSNTDQIIPYDGGDIFIERVSSPSIQDTGELKDAIHPASGIRTNVQPLDMTKSPTGFNYGYAGSGPTCFAINVLLMFSANSEDAYSYASNFRDLFITNSQADKLIITWTEILAYMSVKNIPLKRGLK